MEPTSASKASEFNTMSGRPVREVYGPEDIRGGHADKIGNPGEYPFTRGPYGSMYRGRN
jgi:methylmalonyl-CoA mutase N-terminal domain/subunit